MKTTLALVSIGLSINAVQAANLSTYRKTLSPEILKTLPASIDKRRSELHELLGNFPKLVVSGVEYPGLEVRPRPNFASAFFKRNIQSLALELRREGMFGVESVKDPSKSTEAALREESYQLQRKFDASLRNLPALVEQIVIFRSDNKLASVPVAVSKEGLELEKSLTEITGRFIAENQPSHFSELESYGGQKPKKIQDVLGTLTKAEILDSVVTRLLFAIPVEAKAAKQPSTRVLPISLSMLVNMRTNRDPYFLKSLQMLLTRLQTEVDKFYDHNRDGSVKVDPKTFEKVKIAKISAENEQWLFKLELAADYIAKTITGAAFAASTLSQLNSSQLDFLISVFLDLRSNDIVTDEELTPIKLSIYQNKDAEALRGSREMLDIDFYSQLNDDLMNLKDFLTMEAPLKKMTESLEAEVKAQKQAEPKK